METPDAEWIGVIIGFLGVLGLFLGMYLDNRMKRQDLLNDIEAIRKDRGTIAKEKASIQRDREAVDELKKTLRTVMDYVSVQRDEIRVLQSQLSSYRTTSEELLGAQKEQLAWNKLTGIARALGWVLSRATDED